MNGGTVGDGDGFRDGIEDRRGRGGRKEGRRDKGMDEWSGMGTEEGTEERNKGR